MVTGSSHLLSVWFRQVFCDFSPTFVVTDPTGEEPASVMLASISHDSDGLVTCHDETRHGFEDGDYVVFNEVQGMTELNDGQPRKITVKGPFTFAIGDTSQYSPYIRGGTATQVKQPKTIQFVCCFAEQCLSILDIIYFYFCFLLIGYHCRATLPSHFYFTFVICITET